jgi:hypothetical protein
MRRFTLKNPLLRERRVMASRLQWGAWLCVLAVFGALPALGQANFGGLTLGANKQAGSLTGSTGGSTSLPAIVSNRDRTNHKCLGFGDPTPDHILVLQQNVPSLKLRVNSGSDTTLVVQGPGGVRCGDDSKGGKDASLTDTDWQAGTYKIWVGTVTPGERRDYTLYIRQ